MKHAADPTSPPLPPFCRAYKTLNVVESRNEPGDKERDDVARQGGAVLRLDLADPKAPSLTITNAAFGDACVTWVELAKPGLRSCPLGTVRDANPLGGAAFAPEQCAPCEPGTACADNPDGAPEAQSPLALPCAPGQYNELWGATECAACTGLKMSAFPGATLCQVRWTGMKVCLASWPGQSAGGGAGSRRRAGMLCDVPPWPLPAAQHRSTQPPARLPSPHCRSVGPASRPTRSTTSASPGGCQPVAAAQHLPLPYCTQAPARLAASASLPHCFPAFLACPAAPVATTTRHQARSA